MSCKEKKEECSLAGNFFKGNGAVKRLGMRAFLRKRKKSESMLLGHDTNTPGSNSSAVPTKCQTQTLEEKLFSSS